MCRGLLERDAGVVEASGATPEELVAALQRQRDGYAAARRRVLGNVRAIWWTGAPEQ